MSPDKLSPDKLSPDKLSHVGADGAVRMVDVAAKAETAREAVARCFVAMAGTTVGLIRAGEARKGDVLGTARLAGIMAAKHTATLIPLCHPLPIVFVDVACTLRTEGGTEGVAIEARVRTRARTGVEMEALTAAGIAALTVYDMCKAVDRGMRIEALRVVHKSGGASGVFEQP